MKLLNLKYKMHKLVNLFFYLIVFGIGFLLGFGAEKINFNKLISQFLFIDNVSAVTITTCRDSVNLFNKNNISLDRYVSSSDGELGKLSSAFATDYIEITPNTSYYWNDSTDRNNAGAFYDENKEFILGIRNRNFISPSNAKYVRLTGLSENLEIMQLNKGSLALPYEIYGEKICFEVENDSFYDFSQNIFGEVNEENKFIYDFITFGLVATCFILFVLVVGYIFNKFFGG